MSETTNFHRSENPPSRQCNRVLCIFTALVPLFSSAADSRHPKPVDFRAKGVDFCAKPPSFFEKVRSFSRRDALSA